MEGEDGEHVQLDNDRSIYRQIADFIEDGILSGAFLEEQAVPSSNQLARLWKINPATAAKGINQLVDSGLLYKRRGVGMYVSPGAPEMVRQRRMQVFYEERLSALVREAEQLGISREQLAQWILSEDGAPKK